MPHYAELNKDNEVLCVLYLTNDQITNENGDEIEQLGIDHLHQHHGADRKWVRTSYNGNFRGKYAGIGDIYKEDLDIFISPQPYPSWILNETKGTWEPPIPYPSDGLTYKWNENINNWEIENVSLDS